MVLPDPVTRKEMYLNRAATGSGSVPAEPVTREEMYLAEIANGGGSGSGGASSLADLSDVSFLPPFTIGSVLTFDGNHWTNKDQVGAVRFPIVDDAVITTVNNVISLIKAQAKSTGAKGTKIDYDGSSLISRVLTVANGDMIPVLMIGRNATRADLYLFAGGSTTDIYASFAADQIDADGTYHVTISFAATYAMISATYVACPEMG